MKNTIKTITIAIGVLFAVNSLADEKGPHYQFGIGPSLALMNSTVGFGGTVNLLANSMIKELPDLALGIESGFYYWSASSSSGSLSTSASVTSIPILPFALYKFRMPNSNLKPYLGIALGVSVTSGSANYSVGSVSGGGSSTQVQFEFLAKPGVEISSFFIEPKLGTLNGNFVFLPTVGYYFSL